MIKRIVSAILICLFAATFPLAAAAQVRTVSGPTDGDAVYIAGNPELYPIEYYDSETKTYRGILPDLYQEISEKIGLNFTYIRGGSRNEQKRLAENNQVEIVSGYAKGDVEGLTDSIDLFSFEKDGEIVEICIGFTEAADPEMTGALKEALEAVSDSRLLSMALAVPAQRDNTEMIGCFVIGALFVLSVVAAILAVLLVKRRQKTRKRQQEEQIDSLTGIGNELFFREKYVTLIDQDIRSLYYMIYLSFPVQRMIQYFGTSRTEKLQCFAAGVLSSERQTQEFVARVDQGVFLCAYQASSEEKLKERLLGLLNQVNCFEDGFPERFQVPFRAGIVHLSASDSSFETVVFHARSGYRFAEQNKRPYIFADASFLNKEAEKARLQQRFVSALEEDEFSLYLQFIVDAKDGSIRGAEALSRWQNPERGLLLPAHYVDGLHGTGIMEEFDFYIFEKVCRQLEEWSQTEKKDLWISCNFSRVTVSSEDFLQKFEEIVRKFHFERKNLILELTEESFDGNKERVYQNILACKEEGFRIALDDMGSGYSSLRDLCDYPIDMIKIDRHIVAKSVTDRGNALLCGLTKLAHDLGMLVLCEGVETAQENQNARNAECDYIQGFYYSHVLPKEEAGAYFAKYQKHCV